MKFALEGSQNFFKSQDSKFDEGDFSSVEGQESPLKNKMDIAEIVLEMER